MYPLDRRTPYCFVNRLFPALHLHRFLLIAIVLLLDLAWGGPASLAQTTVPFGLLDESGATKVSFMSNYRGFDGGTTAVPSVSLSPATDGASSAEDSLRADSGTLSVGNYSFDLTEGGLWFPPATPTSGLIMPGWPTLSAAHLHSTSALLGRPAVAMILGANAQPRQKLESGKSFQPTRYWTLRRRIETAGVTLLHMADAAQTCWHEVNTPRWHEQNPMTPNSCMGASVALIGSGPIFQWASYRLMQRYPHSRFWAHVDHVLPQMEISISVMSIRCSHTGSCNQYGF